MRGIEEILEDIRNPDLDSSLEDIEAMVESVHERTVGEEGRPGGEEGRPGGLQPQVQEVPRVSPEFTRAAGLLEQVRRIVILYQRNTVHLN